MTDRNESIRDMNSRYYRDDVLRFMSTRPVAMALFEGYLKYDSLLPEHVREIREALDANKEG